MIVMEIKPSPINLINTHIIPIRFEYFEPKTLDEALDILRRFGNEAKILAGGTDLIVQMKLRRIEPKYIVNIKKIPNLRYIKVEDGKVRIGTLTKLRDIEKSDVIKKYFPALYEAVRHMGSVQIRCMGTIGGNLCNASPAADSAPPLMVHNAKLTLVSKDGRREVPIEKFFLGPGKTVLKPNEMLLEIEVPIPRNVRYGSAFLKISRVSMDLAKVNVAAYVEVSEGVISNVRIALGAVAPTPIRAYRAEEFLRGKKPDEGTLRKAGEIASSETRPIDDLRSTAWYRREVSKVLVRDALRIAYERALKGW